MRRAWHKTYELKRKATEAKENMISHRERTRRITIEHAKAEALVNNSLGTLGHAVRDAAAATHSLTCGLLDRESNEIKHLREATDLLETWHGQSASRPPSEHSEVILIERQW